MPDPNGRLDRITIIFGKYKTGSQNETVPNRIYDKESKADGYWLTSRYKQTSISSLGGRRCYTVKSKPRGVFYLWGEPAVHWYVPKDGGVFYWSFHDALINYSVRILLLEEMKK